MHVGENARLVAVVVTFGDRRELLLPVLQALLEQDASHIVLVDHGSVWPVAEQLGPRFGARLTVLRLSAQQSTAAAFAAGIQAACAGGDQDLIFLVDDDNVPQPHCLSLLRQAYQNLLPGATRASLAVLAYRPEHLSDIGYSQALGRVTFRPGSFRGFHLADLPGKLWRRRPWARAGKPSPLAPYTDVPYAPFSGLLFHRELIAAHGLPREDFVYYMDDTEFTYRITRSGGRIVLVGAATLDASKPLGHALEVDAGTSDLSDALKHESKARLYYGTRNDVYFHTHCAGSSRLLFHLNLYAYLAVLGGYALISGRIDRFRLMREAVRDGLAGRLGRHPQVSR
jgi:GT2 family glycosyltransferase